MSATDTAGVERHGPMFWLCLVVGGAVMAYGVWGAVQQSHATLPLVWASYIIGLALAHDLVLAPIVYLIGTRVTVPLRGWVRTAVQVGLIVSGTVMLFAYPFVFRFGQIGDNPSFLPSDYWLGLVETLALVWVGSVGVVWWAWRRR